MGQHFLVRDAILERLAKAACGEHTSRVIEIGPGKGALTRHLLPRTEELHAVEIDVNLFNYLEEKFRGEKKLHVHHRDVLATDLAQWGPAAIVGNLPYYITSPIVERFISLDASFPLAVFLMQREVAERIMASPGHKTYGFLTVTTQLVCEVELVCHVPAAAFLPPPTVDSAAIRLQRKTEIPADLAELRQFVSRCFTQKRKTLRNNLRPFYGTKADELPEASRRAEELPISTFVEMFASLARSGMTT